MRLRTITTVAVAIATGLAGCGSDKEGKQLPSQSVSELNAQLSSIQSRFDVPNGAACDDITGGSDPNTTVVQRVIDSLPSDTDSDLRNAVQQSFDHLFDLVQQECGAKRDQTSTDTTTPTDTTDTDTTPTDTTGTDTSPTETTDTTTSPTDTTDTTTTSTDDTGNGNGNGNGQGSGGGASGPGGGNGE